MRCALISDEGGNGKVWKDTETIEKKRVLLANPLASASRTGQGSRAGGRSQGSRSGCIPTAWFLSPETRDVP